MSHSALHHPSLLHGGSRETWRTRPHLLELQDELDRTRQELATLRSATARVLTAILAELQTESVTVAPVIQKLGDLVDAGRGQLGEDPLAAGIEAIDTGNQESLAYLDRRFRWLPSRSGG